MSKILVVDDEPDLRFMLRRIFTRAGHEVTEAGNGAAALASVHESAPDLVVTDIMMPVMDGVELTGSGGRREFHPPAPADPGVTVSCHRALVILLTRRS